MSTTSQHPPTSHLRFGLARADITPPVGIYHRMWGAARHDQSSGVHRPLLADVMAFGPVDGDEPALIRAQIDLVGLVQEQHEEMLQAMSEAARVPSDQVLITYSHTHAAGILGPDRFALPGGDKIPPYLAELRSKLADACGQAVATMQEAIVTYARGCCDMAANRDYWDEENQIYACGFNPDAPADDTVVVARISDRSGQLLATLINYACHPTTLAWDNTLISPDYVGALRQEVEQVTSAPCVFAQGACGDLGPRQGFVGDTDVADQNGRQLAYAALSTLAAMDPPATDFTYAGPVVSGATIGTWTHTPLTPERLAEAASFSGGKQTVDLPLKPKPDPTQLEEALAQWEERYQEAVASGEEIEARNARARAERARRWLMRLSKLPKGDTYALGYSVHRLGDAFWVTCGGEPYNLLQRELRRRFPKDVVLVSPLSGDQQVAYLLPEDRYGKGLYQEEPSILAPGCLETLIETISARMATLHELT